MSNCTGAQKSARVENIFIVGVSKKRMVSCSDCGKKLYGIGAYSPNVATVPNHKSA